MNKRRILGCYLLVLVVFFLNGCTSSSFLKEDEVSIRESIQTDSIQSSGSEGIVMPEIYYAESLQDARDMIEKVLEDSSLDYQWICRDSIIINGIEQPCLWIYAVNRYHEWMDIILMEEPLETFYQMLYGNEGISPDNPAVMRKNEAASYQHKFRAARWDTGLGAAVVNENENQSFSFCITGNTFAMNDLDAGIDSSVGRAEQSKHGRVLDPSLYSSEPEMPGYEEYYPESDMQAEIRSMQNRLTATGLDYRWEIKETINVHGKEYPVVWMFAKNREGEWLDVVFSEDPDLCYLLYHDKNRFSDLRREEIQSMNSKHPGKEKAEDSAASWIVQDVFYNGYSFYMEGNAFAMFDSGMVSEFVEWNDILKKNTLYNSRELIWYLNYTPDYENYH